MARTDGGGADGDGEARPQEADDQAHSTRLTTNQKGAAPLTLGHRSDHGDDGRRTADGELRPTSVLGGVEGGGDVQKDGVLTLSAWGCSSVKGKAGAAAVRGGRRR